jgi:hypothetical protein
MHVSLGGSVRPHVVGVQFASPSARGQGEGRVTGLLPLHLGFRAPVHAYLKNA